MYSECDVMRIQSSVCRCMHVHAVICLLFRLHSLLCVLNWTPKTYWESLSLHPCLSFIIFLLSCIFCSLPLSVTHRPFSRYQSSQQHPEAQHVMPYHNMGLYSEGSREPPVMTELSVHQELPLHQDFPSHQNYPSAHHQQEMANQQSFREQQQQPVLHHPHHPSTKQHQAPGVQHQPQPAAPAQGTEEVTELSEISQRNISTTCTPLDPIYSVITKLCLWICQQ